MRSKFDLRPLATAYTWRDGKHRMHALPCTASGGPAFCGLDPGMQGWENLGRLGSLGILSHNLSCDACRKAAQEAYVLRHLEGLGGKADVESLLVATRMFREELVAALNGLSSRGHVAGRPEAEGERRPMFYAVTVLGGELLDRDFSDWRGAD